MSTSLTMAPTISFHLSLNVTNLRRSVDFFRILFGVEPAKCRPDYAKFELSDPPVVLSLEPSAHGRGGALNHLGFRLSDAGSLVTMQERLEMAGIRSQREEGVECCYARQTKFWVQDPDQNLWEMYILEEDLDHRGIGQREEAIRPPAQEDEAPAPVVWEHRLGAPVPATVDFADGTVDEVLLRGSFNIALDGDTKARLIRESYRILRPGGRLFVHVLVTDRALSAPPQLPGPAAQVQHVPHEAEPQQLLESAGFRDIHFAKFDAKPCFVRQGAALRELQLVGWKPQRPSGSMRMALYRGPFRQVVDDAGTSYPRGVRVPADSAKLPSGSLADQFVILEAADCHAS